MSWKASQTRDGEMWRSGFDTCMEAAQDSEFYLPGQELGTNVAILLLVEEYHASESPANWTDADNAVATEGCRDAFEEAWANFPD